MKQLLFLLLFPCLCMAQYTGNEGQKITLGEQTTADGLVWRGRLADTANLLTNKLDTSVYIVLDTGTRAMWYYRASTTPKWTRLVDSLNNLQGTLSITKGGTGSPTQNFVDLTTTQSIGGVKTFSDTIIVSKGIRFPSTQSASTNVNTLDDYEEGTWTPIYQGLGGSIGSTAYSAQRGRYTKIGRFVHASGEIILTNKGSWSSGVVIEGLPYITTAAEYTFGFIVLGFVDFAAEVKYCQFVGTGGANNRAYIDTIKDNLDREILLTTAISNNSSFAFSFIYTTSN